MTSFEACFARLSRLGVDLDELVDDLERLEVTYEQAELLAALPVTHLALGADRLAQLLHEPTTLIPRSARRAAS